MIYRFDEYSMDVEQYALWRGPSRVAVRPKVFDTLRFLIEHRDRVVPRQDLMAELWPGKNVYDYALAGCISEARTALGDDGSRQLYIRTVPGTGYQFTGCIKQHSGRCSTGCIEAHSDEGVSSDHAVISHLYTVIRSDFQRTTPVESSAGQSGTSYPSCEYRTVTVLACSLKLQPSSGYSQAGADAYAVKRSFDRVVRQVADEYGGHVAHQLSTEAMILFGAPKPCEDHAVRAVLSALALRQMCSQVQPLPEGAKNLAVGVHTGSIVFDRSDRSRVGAIMSVEETFEHACQLQENAQPGKTLVSRITLDCLPQTLPVRAAVDATGTVPATCELGEIDPSLLTHDRLERRALSTFVGRIRELETLACHLSEASERRGQVLSVVAEPGMGKSRLLHEFRSKIDEPGCRVLIGRCVSYGTRTPYLPLLGILRQACGITALTETAEMAEKIRGVLRQSGQNVDELLPLFLQLFGQSKQPDRPDGFSPEERKARLFDSLVRIVVHLGEQESLVVAVEDLHWIDPTSEEWLNAFINKMVRLPIMLLVTFRPGYQPKWMDRSFASQLNLKPLEQNDSLSLIWNQLGRNNISADLVETILDRADGNPFFLEDLLQSVQDSALDSLMNLPRTVQALLGSRIDRLPDDSRRILQVCSVCCQTLPYSVLEAVVDLPAERLRIALSLLEERELLHETYCLEQRAYGFRHELTREAAYRTLLNGTRAEMHRQFVWVLSERLSEIVESRPELMAYHLAGAGYEEESVHFWKLAVRRALESAASREAIQLVLKAVKALKRLPDKPKRTQQAIELLLVLSPAFEALRETDAPAIEVTCAILGQLSSECSDPTFQPPQSLLHLVQGDLSEIEAFSTRLLDDGKKEQNIAQSLAARALLVYVLLHQGRFTEAMAQIDKLWKAYRLVDRDLMAFLEAQLSGLNLLYIPVLKSSLSSLLLTWMGLLEQAEQEAQRAVSTARELGQPFSLVFSLYVDTYRLIDLGDFERAKAQAESTIALSTQHDLPVFQAGGTVLGGFARFKLGLHAAGIEQMHEGIEAWKKTGTTVTIPKFFCLLAEAQMHMGLNQDAQQSLDEAQHRMELNGEWLTEATIYTLRGELLARSPDLADQAEEFLRRACETARRQHANSFELRASASLGRLRQRRDGQPASSVFAQRVE